MKLTLVSKASGMIAGLELWSVVLKGDKRFTILIDRSIDGRFASDVIQWNSSIAGLNAATLKKIKDATA
jgi:hypothetical protein